MSFELPCFVINLERSQDRLKSFMNSFNASDIKTQELYRLEAIDGKELQKLNEEELLEIMTPDILKELRETERFGSRLSHSQHNFSSYASYLSHLELYKIILKNYEMAVIFEDDALLHPNFFKIIKNLLNIVPKDWDIILLGYNCQECPIVNNYRQVTSFYGTHGYLINRKGAIKMMKDKFPANIQIDLYMSRLAQQSILNIYASDSEIQFAHQSPQFKTLIQMPLRK